MDNPYYQLVALIRAQSGRGGDGPFSAKLKMADEKIAALTVEGDALEGDLWRVSGLELTAEDDGKDALCLPFDRGFLVLGKIEAE